MTSADVAGSIYGAKLWNASLAPGGPRNVGLGDRNDYYRVQAFRGKLYLLSGGAYGGFSAIYRLDTKPRPEAPLSRPALPVVAGTADDWQVSP